MMGTAAGLHCDDARRKTFSEPRDVRRPHAPPFDDFARPSSPTGCSCSCQDQFRELQSASAFSRSFESPATIKQLAEGAGHPINFPAVVAAVAEKTGGKPKEIWFGDEARIGQKNKITRRWAKRGTRPSAPRDQRTASAYIFGAICPQHGKGAGLVLPSCNTEAMALHLEEIAAAVAPGAHAILVLDQAGWHVSKTLPVPPNITLVSLPPKSPELNPVENIWQFMRDNWLSNRVFTSYANIVDHCCYAWNKLVDQPWLIMSIGTRQWANRSCS